MEKLYIIHRQFIYQWFSEADYERIEDCIFVRIPTETEQEKNIIKNAVCRWIRFAFMGERYRPHHGRAAFKNNDTTGLIRHFAKCYGLGFLNYVSDKVKDFFVRVPQMSDKQMIFEFLELTKHIFINSRIKFKLPDSEIRTDEHFYKHIIKGDKLYQKKTTSQYGLTYLCDLIY